MMLIYGHRGESKTFWENSMPAFAAAVASGADGLEFDVRATAEDMLVIHHDRTLQRLYGDPHAIDLMPMEYLASLGASQDRICTLRDVLETIPAHIHLDIELKTGGIEPLLLQALQDIPYDRYAVSSFDWTSLERLRELDHAVELWPITAAVTPALFDLAGRIGASAVSLWHVAYDEQEAAALAAAGLDAVLWTVNDSSEAERIRRLGGAAICTDCPSEITG